MIQTKGQFSVLNDFINKSNSYLNNEKNKEKSEAYIYLILSFFALSFFGIFAIQPTLTTITELDKEYNENKVLLQQLKDKNQKLASLRTQYQQIKDDFPLIVKAIPETPKASTLTRQIETVASKNSLSIDKIEIGLLEIFPATIVDTQIFSFTFSTTVRGDQENINNFLKEIVNIDRIVGVQRLSTGNDQQAFEAVITGKAFYYKQKDGTQ